MPTVAQAAQAAVESAARAARESAESRANAALAAYSKAKLFKADRYQVERSRHVLVLVGLTGAGKSSTGNTLCGARRAFVRASSVASVTSAVSVRDYEFEGRKWRVIDTPGLGDTSVSEETTKEELLELFRYARHGITCFVVVVRKGRFTAEQEWAVRRTLELIGGDAVVPYCLLAVTDCVDPQEKLLDDIARLPRENALRRLAALVNDRVLPVENLRDPARGVSRLLLHHGALEVLELNGGPWLPDEAVHRVGALALAPRADWREGLVLQGCTSTWDPGHLRLTTVCSFSDGHTAAHGGG